MNVTFSNGQSILFKLYRGGYWECGDYVAMSGNSHIVVATDDNRVLFAYSVKDTINHPAPGDLVECRDNIKNNFEGEYVYRGTLVDGTHIVTDTKCGYNPLISKPMDIIAWAFVRKIINESVSD